MIGVVGAGRIAQRFVPEASFVSYVKVNGVYDIDDSQTYSFAYKHKLARVYESYDALLDNVQAVYIATPHLSHYELCKRALQEKKHVLCETPLVLNAAEAKELFELAKTNDVVLMESHFSFFVIKFGILLSFLYLCRQINYNE